MTDTVMAGYSIILLLCVLAICFLLIRIDRYDRDIHILYQRSDKRNKENELERQNRVKLTKKVVQLEDWKRRSTRKPRPTS